MLRLLGNTSPQMKLIPVSILNFINEALMEMVTTYELTPALTVGACSSMEAMNTSSWSAAISLMD